MPKTARVNTAAKELGKIIGDLEVWQNRFASADPENDARHAKSDLIRLLARLNENDATKA